jgi:WD40 repeat protein
VKERALKANPYFGSFAIPPEAHLYGRDVEIADLVDILVAQRIVLLYSPSGAGKTSLIQAGLVKRLREKEQFRVSVIRGFAGIAALDRGFKGNRYVASVIEALDDAWPASRRHAGDIATLTLREYLDGRPPCDREGPADSEEHILVFDQFEEILTLDALDCEAKKEFFQQLGDALKDRSRLALFSMREDHVAGLDDYLHFVPTSLRTSYRLGLLDREHAEAAIVGPAARVEVLYEQRAVETLVDDLRTTYLQTEEGTERRDGDFVEPVQLQVACHNLWQSAQPECKITVEDVRSAGVDRALEDYYETAVSEAAAISHVPERDIREWVEDKLITPRGIRAQVLSEPNHAGGLSHAAIRPLEDKAHLVRLESRGNRRWYELAHDRLIEPVRGNNAAWFRTKLAPVQQRARQWLNDSRNEKHLLSLAEVVTTAAWRQEHAHQLRPTEAEFVRQSKRALAVSSMKVVAFVLFLGFYGFWTHFTKLQAEDQAQREAQTAASIKILNDSSDVKLRYARVELLSARAPSQALREAIESAPEYIRVRANFADANTREARNALDFPVQTGFIEALRKGQGTRAVLLGEPRTARAVAFNPGSTEPVIAYGGSTGQVFMAYIDSGMQRPVAHCPLEARAANGIYAIAFSDDGRLLAAGCESGDIVVWETQDWKQQDSWRGHRGTTRVVAFTHDGSRVMSGGSDSKLVLKKVGDPSGPVEFKTQPGRPNGHIWSGAYSAKRNVFVASDGISNLWVCDPGSATCRRAVSAPAVRPADGSDSAYASQSLRDDAAIALTFAGTDDEALISSYWSGRILRWNGDLSAATVMRDPSRAWGGPSTGPVYSMAAARGTSSAASLLYFAADQRLQVDGAVTPVDEHLRSRQLRVIGDDVLALAFHAGSRTLAAATASGPVIVIDTAGASDALMTRVPVGPASGLARVAVTTPAPREPIRGAVVDLNAGTAQLLVAQDSAISLLEIPRGDPAKVSVRDRADASTAIKRVAGSATAKVAVTLAAQGELDVWSVANGRLQRRAQQRCAGGRRIALTPGGERLICATLSTIEVLDLEKNARKSYPMPFTQIREIALSADGSRLAVGGELDRDAAATDVDSDSMSDAEVVLLMDVRDGALSPRSMVQLTALAGAVFELGFATSVVHEGDATRTRTLLIAAGRNGYVNVWDASNGSLIAQMRGDARPIYQLAFDPSAPRMASVDDRGRILLWDITRSERNQDWPAIKLSGPGLAPEAPGFLAFGFDGGMLFSGGGTLAAWDLDVDSLRRKACIVFGAQHGSNRTLVGEEIARACGD